MDIETRLRAERQASVCRVFSSPRRILILWALAGGEHSVTEIARMVKASMQNTSHHLRVMKDQGILYSHRIGQSVSYGIARPEQVEHLIEIAPQIEEGLPLNLPGAVKKT